MIKLILTDIDGTLGEVNTSKLPEEYFDVIGKLMDKGILFGAASGRTYGALCKLFSPVKDRMIFISENGAKATYLDEELFSIPMTIEEIRELILDTKKIEGCQSVCQTKDKSYFGPEDKDVYRIMRDYMHFDVEMIDDLMELDAMPLKYTLYHPVDAEKVTEGYFQDKWKKTHQVACSGANYIDVTGMEANKGDALKKLQKRFQVTPEETMVFGDNINDIAMLGCAYYSYAVGDAREEVKEKARFIAPKMVEDGVLQVLKTLL